MYIYFLINNIRFALEIFGAVVFLMATWLTIDATVGRHDASTRLRATSFGILTGAFALHALNYGSDVVSYLSVFLYAVGGLLLAISFKTVKKLEVSAVVIIPAFATWSASLYGLITCLLLCIGYLAYQQYKREYNLTWLPFSYGFFAIALGLICELGAGGDPMHVLSVVGSVVEAVGLGLLAKWVWQFLMLRIRESMILIFISGALFLSTVVTLAFSTILIGRIATETQNNLTTDAKVFDLTIQSLKDESLAKGRIMAQDTDIVSALTKQDSELLDRALERLLETEKVGFITLADKEGTVLARAHALTRRGDSIISERVYEEGVQGNPFVTIEKDAVEGLSVRAGVPVVQAGKVLAVLVVGYPLDNAMVDGIKQVTGLEMFVYDHSTSIAGTALSEDGRSRIVGATLHDVAVQKNVLIDGLNATSRTVLFGNPFLASFLPLINADGKIIGMISAAKSEQSILDLANATNRLTLITIIVIMLALAWPIYRLTKRIGGER